MIALQVAAGFPERVSALVLMTRHRYQTRALLSVSEGVVGLLPVGTLQRLGVRPRRIVELLDRVRPVDFRLLAPQVSVPALVLVGEQDRANRGPSAALAKALPQGRLRVVPGAGAEWPYERPDELAELVTRL
jgi:pimeloyl-ACP methyl ester carboxylesterase